MKKSAILILVVSLFCVSFADETRQEKVGSSHRVVVNFNTQWLFTDVDIENGQAAHLPEKYFVPVCLPHTIKIVKHSDIDTSVFARISWYRKHFTPPIKYKGKRFLIEFQAVSKVAEVFVNEQKVGEHKGAYTSFTFDITNFVKIGEDNVVAVRVDSRQHKDIPPESMNVDYMLFGGIVRDVNMIVVDPVYVDWVYVFCDTTDTKRIAVQTNIINNDRVQKKCWISTTIVDSSKAIVATVQTTQTIAAGSSYVCNYITSPLVNPVLWHPDHPYLYEVFTKVQDSATFIDEQRTFFGMRTVTFSKTEGTFSINGQPLKLRGLNRHESYPFVGRAASNRLQEKDADILKYDFGCNIVRCSHYPQDPEFLDRCDKIGLLVLEEMPGWLFVGKNPAWQAIALKNVEEMIMRDRNHPSIISFGVRINESSDRCDPSLKLEPTGKSQECYDLYSETNRLAKKLDPIRPTHGVRVLGFGSIGQFNDDVWAQNFFIPKGTPPHMPWITTECVGHRFATHSWDDEQRLINQMLAHAAAQDSGASNPQIAGILGWTGFDYNSPYRYADKKICYHGVADIFRIPKHAAYLFASQKDPKLYGAMVYIAHSWKKALSPNTVWVASNCDSVELFVNNISKGKHAPAKYMSLAHPLFVWDSLPFTPGEIRANGYIKGALAASFTRKTPGVPVALTITPDDTVLQDCGDMTRVIVTAVDRFGQVVPQTKNSVLLSVNGAGDFMGESPIYLEDGKTAFYVKTRTNETGSIICIARCKNMKDVIARITVVKNLAQFDF